MKEVYEAQCHCGSLGWKLTTSIEPRDWVIRACQCTFCRSHGARCTSDTHGTVDFVCDDDNALVRYRFGLQTADFVLCGCCGVYLGAVLTSDHGAYTTVNINTLMTPVGPLREAEAVHYDAEDEASRRDRRQRVWTPVSAGIELFTDNATVSTSAGDK